MSERWHRALDPTNLDVMRVEGWFGNHWDEDDSEPVQEVDDHIRKQLFTFVPSSSSVE